MSDMPAASGPAPTNPSQNQGAGGPSTSTPAPSAAASNPGGLPQTSGGGGGNPSSSSPELHDVKVNGKLVKMSLQEMRDYASMSYAADQKFKEAAQFRREEEMRKAAYKKNPIQALLDATSDLSPEQRRSVLEDYYAKNYIEPETLSKEELALRDREERVKKWEEQQRTLQEEHRAQQEKALTERERGTINEQIIEMLEQSNLPKKNKFLIQRIASYMRQNLLNGYDAPREVIVRQVQNEHQGIIWDYLGDATPEQIVAHGGERAQAFINRLLKHHVEQIRQNRQKLNEPFQADPSTGYSNPGEKIDYSEVSRRLRDIRNGRFTGSS